MKTLSILLGLTYIIFNAETGDIAKATHNIKIEGRNVHFDNGSMYECNAVVGTTTQYVWGVEIETNDIKIVVDGTKNTNELTDVKIVTFQDLKPTELKQVENSFLLICSNFTGNVTQKLTFAQVYGNLKDLKKRDKELYNDTRDELIFVDAWGKKFDKDWWDTCVWHPEIVQ